MPEDPTSRSRGPDGPTRIIDILISERGWAHQMPDLEPRVQAVAAAVLDTPEAFRFAPGMREKPLEVSLCFGDNDFVETLNSQFRGRDKPTNVLSFPSGFEEESLDGEALLIGDIILAFGVVEAEARDQEKAFSDHTLHLVIHGLLHLLGHDHEDDAGAAVMEALEIKLLNSFGIQNPYE